jgi:hypothetical protein
MFSALMKSVLAGAALSVALSTAAPAAAHAKAPLVMTEGEAPAADLAGGGKVWFAFMWPETLKPQLEEKKMLLTVVGLLPFGSVWGPIALLGQGFDLEWALPSIIYSAIAVSWWWVPFYGWVLWTLPALAINWIATQTMFANLNRPEVTVGGGDAVEAPK